MTLKIDNAWGSGFQTSWRDTANRKLEGRLNEVMVGLYRVAHAHEVRAKQEDQRRQRVEAENARRAALRDERQREEHFLVSLDRDASAPRSRRKVS